MSLGYSEQLFWTLTPRQLSRHFNAANKRMVREHEDRMYHAWNIGWLSQAAKYPKFDDLIAKQKPKTKQPWEQIKASMMLALPNDRG